MKNYVWVRQSVFVCRRMEVAVMMWRNVMTAQWRNQSKQRPWESMKIERTQLIIKHFEWVKWVSKAWYKTRHEIRNKTNYDQSQVKFYCATHGLLKSTTCLIKFGLYFREFQFRPWPTEINSTIAEQHGKEQIFNFRNALWWRNLGHWV